MCLTLLVRTELDRKKNVVGQANAYKQACIVYIALYMPILERFTYLIINMYFCHLSALIVPLAEFLSFMRKRGDILSFMRKPRSDPPECCIRIPVSGIPPVSPTIKTSKSKYTLLLAVLLVPFPYLLLT